MAFYAPIGCVRFARYCGNICSRHLFPYGGLVRILCQSLLAGFQSMENVVRFHYSIPVILRIDHRETQYNSDFILILLTNKLIAKLGRAGVKNDAYNAFNAKIQDGGM